MKRNQYSTKKTADEKIIDGRVTEIDTDIADGVHVETWYDEQSDNWITQLLTASGFQIGDALFAGDAVGAKHAHEEMVKQAEDRLEKELADRDDREAGALEIVIADDGAIVDQLRERVVTPHGALTIYVSFHVEGCFGYAIEDADTGETLTADTSFSSLTHALNEARRTASRIAEHYFTELKPHQSIEIELTKAQSEWVDWAIDAMQLRGAAESLEVYGVEDVTEMMGLASGTLVIHRFDSEEVAIDDRSDVVDLLYRLEEQAQDMAADELDRSARAAANAAEKIREALAPIVLAEEDRFEMQRRQELIDDVFESDEPAGFGRFSPEDIERGDHEYHLRKEDGMLS